MKLINKIALPVHITFGYCQHCQQHQTTRLTKADIQKYHGPYCKECGRALEI